MNRTREATGVGRVVQTLGELTMSHLYLLGVASLTLTSAGFAGSDMNADLQTRLEAAEARIAELSADQNQNWLNDERAYAVQSLVQDVLADADTRASLQGSGGDADYDGGFVIASGDGNWSLKLNGAMWTSWTTVDDKAAGSDTDGGFDAPTSWMNYSGTIAGDFSFDIRHDWDHDWDNAAEGETDLDWANAGWDLSDGWGITMGTFRLHQGRVSQIDDQYQMEIGHNPNANVENGLAIDYTGDNLRFWVEMTNGNDTGTANDGDYNFNLRGEYMAEGNWGQFDQFTSAEGGAAGTLIGLGYNSLNNSDASDGDATWNVDVQMQFGGYGIYVAYTDFSDDSGAAGDWDQTDIMGSYYLNSDWELYAAYSDLNNSSDVHNDGSTFAVGVNNYWAGQNARWTTQYTQNERDVDGDVDTFSTQLQFYF